MAKEELKPIDVSKYTITETGQVLKMNKNKCFLNGGRGSGKTFRLLCEIYENKIADLEKEIIELKEKNKWYSEQVCNKECAEVRGELTKAKEIIKKFSEFVNNEIEYDSEHPQEHTDLWNELCKQAEQFLKDSEVKKC